MRDDFTSEFRSTSVRVGHIGQFEVDHAISLKHIESMAERTDHRTVADPRNVFETGDYRHGGPNPGPIVASRVPLHGEGKHPALLVRLCQTARLHDALQLVSVLQKLQWIIRLWARALGGLRGIPAGL